MDNRREFLKKASILASGAGMMHALPASIQRALAINPAPGSTFFDAEHIVFLMQENRSFDHTYGTLQGVRGFNDPRAIKLANNNPVWLQTDEKGDTYAPFRLNIKETKSTWMSSLPHSWSDQVDARNNGKYDKWLHAKHSGHKEYAPMPLTMGYYDRRDIPFYYALADAFTVCDQNFCSSLTGTTPNRLYFWSGTIREKPEESAMARVWNGDADHDTMVSWKTFPERLEEEGISWKVYQNEVSIGVGFNGEEDAWLANFTDNPLEFFTQYQVRLSANHIAYLPKAEKLLMEEIKKIEDNKISLSETELDLQQKRLKRLKDALATNREDQKNYTREKYDQLSQHEKNIHDKAFAINSGDPDYHTLTTLKYKDGDVEREVLVPKGDVLHQFRQDVKNGKLPTVSWIVAPENYSDHPGAAWYGSWYISEVVDILTQNPEVWKKTIFVLAYDENDGYFDHVPPFVAPHPDKADAGKVSKGIDTSIEYVKMANQSTAARARESSIGLGYRVPLVIASPWSRGGWVCSEVFDHTSSLQFLEMFLSKKAGKKIEESNISAWRRTVCGNLASAFRPYNGETIKKPEFVQHDAFVESIHKAKFKNPPSNFVKLTAQQIEQVRQKQVNGLLPVQEKGTRTASAIPYELYADARLSEDKNSVVVQLKVGKSVFGEQSAGSPFYIYSRGIYKAENFSVRNYAVSAGDNLSDEWGLVGAVNNSYHLQVYGPNGFFREFIGSIADPGIYIHCKYETQKANAAKLTGNIVLSIDNATGKAQTIEIIDNAYKAPVITKALSAVSGNTMPSATINLSKSFGWYDFTIRVKGNNSFSKRYAGHVETGKESKTDPFMGKMV